jgi:HNH endonuclease
VGEDKLLKLLAKFQRIDDEKQYYLITMIASEDGTVSNSTYSHWVGWADGKIGREIRKGSLIKPHSFANHWKSLGRFYMVVNDLEGLAFFLRIGGHALVEKEITEDYFSHIIEPSETVRDEFGGYKSVSMIPDSVKKRAPSPKQRMTVLTRDGMRCRICGRSPDNYTDVELHVHHIMPWGQGGLTETKNLITLCHTCHRGLDPHYSQILFYKTDMGGDMDIEEENERYFEGMRRYQDKMKAFLEEPEGDEL